MPGPSAALSTLRPDIAGSFEEFNLAMDRQGFIGLRVLPVFEVAKASGTFGKITLESLLMNRETTRAAGGSYNRSNYQFETDTFACLENGAEEPVDDREAALYSEYFQAEQIAGQRALDVVLRNHEKRVAAAIFNATTWTGATLTTAVTNEWDDYSNATPKADVEAAIGKVYTLTGLWPNSLIINRKVFRNLRLCHEVIDSIESGGAGSPSKPADIGPDMLARVFDLEQVIVAGASYNSANEGQTATPAQIWSDEYAMVARICTSNDIREPGLGRTFHWGEDGSSIGGTVESYRDETVRSNIIRVRHDTAEKILYSSCGHLLSNITT